MRIDPNLPIAGQPPLKVREFFLKFRDWGWTPDAVGQHFEVTASVAVQINADLVRLGFALPDEERSGWWKATSAGSRLAVATAAKPLLRPAVERKLQEFIDRIRQVNHDEQFVFRVAKAVVFGSYLSAKARISDIDIGILLEPKEKDREKWEALKAKRIQKAHEAGRTFHNIMDQVYWPEKEVLLFLKSRSRSLSLHSMEELTRMTSEFRVLFEECVK